MEWAIETGDLTRRFGRLDAVDGLQLRVPVGSVFGLVGPNGAGKTTTIKLLMNLLRPTRGSARVLGVDSRALTAGHLQRIGYVAESQRPPGWMTVGELLDFCRPLYPAWDEGLCARLQDGLALPRQTRVSALSRGNRMKAALLVSLAYRPELVVLDEPFSGLDPLVRDELIRALLDLATEQPVTTFVSSHDIEELERLADWIGFINDGRLLFAEPVATLLNRFRRVEVVSPGDAPPNAVTAETWLVEGVSGRTLRFIDTNHAADDARARIEAAYPGADIHVSELSLREIFVILARQSARGDRTRSEAR